MYQYFICEFQFSTVAMDANVAFKVYLSQSVFQSWLAMLFNSLTLICLMRYSYLRSPANFLVGNIAICDLLHGVAVGILMPASMFAKNWNSLLCVSRWILGYLSSNVELMCFSLLAIQRHSSLLYRLNKGKNWTKRKVCGLITICWVVNLVYHTVLAANVNFPEQSVCKPNLFVPGYNAKIRTALFCLTLAVNGLFYGHIAFIAYKSQRQVAAQQSHIEQQRQRKDMKITKMMAMVVGVFFLLYAPHYITAATMSRGSPKWRRVLMLCFNALYDVNFWINPMIYAWREPKFNRAFKDMLSCIFACCVRRPTTQSNIGPQGNQAPNGGGICPTNLAVPSVSGQVGHRSPLTTTMTMHNQTRLSQETLPPIASSSKSE